MQQQHLLNIFPPTVLFLDSGVGGLSIYRQVRQLLPALRCIYAFDNAGFPYGEQPPKQVVERVIRLIRAIHQRHTLNMVVLACNTASTAALPSVRTCFSFPVVGVVPAIKPAVMATRNGVIGLLASKATASSPYLDNLIIQFAGQCQVERLGSSELVGLAEAKLRGQVVCKQQITRILAPWLPKRLIDLKRVPDTIVLGCTHFPLLYEELSAVLPSEVRLVDSALAVAQQVERQLLRLYDNQNSPLVAGVEPGFWVDMAYCTRLDSQAQALQPALYQYQFSSLQALSLGNGQSLNGVNETGTSHWSPKNQDEQPACSAFVRQSEE